jgi:single-strand DNA-binding protein
MGRVGENIELRKTPSGIDVCSFSMAVQRTTKKDVTDWIRVVCWRNLAVFVSSHFRKGQLVAVQGSIQTSQYTDRDGNKRTTFDVVADNVFFAEKKAESGETKQGAGYDHSPDIQGDFEEIISQDELPF